MKTFKVLLATTLVSSSLSAQISLQSAVNLALKNSPKVRASQAEVAKTRAARGEAKDAYVPIIATTAGYGQSTGAPLGVPVIFTISAQSLLFSFAQRDYVRSAQAAVEAAEHTLSGVEVEVVEDTTNTYVALDNARQRKAVLAQAVTTATRLVSVTGDRVAAGVDAPVELPRSRRTATQMRLQALLVDDEVAAQSQHLATLTGLPTAGMLTEHTSLPDFALSLPSASRDGEIADSAGIRAAFDIARSKQYVAFGDRRYLLRPQITLGGSYSRVATGLSSYGSYYPRYAGTANDPNSQNSFSFGLQFTVPLLDYGHRSKARGSAAEAARAFAEAEGERGLYRESRAKLRNAVSELNLRAQLARDDREIAQAQLDALRVQLDASVSGSTPVSPRDQLSAELQERQKYLDVLNAELQLRQTQVNLLRQTDGLGTSINGAGTRTTTPVVAPFVNSGANLQGTPPTGVPTPIPALPPQR